MIKNTFIAVFSLLVLILSGCHDHTTSDKSIIDSGNDLVYQTKGKMRISQEAHSHRLKFYYQERQNGDYHLEIVPFLASSIDLYYSHNTGPTVIVKNNKMTNEESLAFLDEVAPNFPWDQLPLILKDQNLNCDCWRLDPDFKEGVIIEHNSQKISVQWIHDGN